MKSGSILSRLTDQCDRGPDMQINDHINFKLNPPPICSSFLSANMPVKSAASPAMRGASPRFGALGLAALLLFSSPAFDGKVGNIAVDFGFGVSWK